MKRVLMITGLSVVLLGVLPDNLSAQGFCQISYSGLNKNRKVMGPVSAECPGDIVNCFPPKSHSYPFGNWGVSSNVGHVIDGHQFQGWCHDHWACDNNDDCDWHCQDSWYEWNSCTTYAQWKPPNNTLYNSNGHTQQVTTRGTNTHGSTATYVYVSCPTDSNGDGICDTGGCADLSSFTSGNWLTLYEIDPCDEDELVQSMYFPSVTVSLSCTAMSCDSATSSWVSPNRYDTPTSPALVNAKVATKVNWGRFVDRDGGCALRARGNPIYDCR